MPENTTKKKSLLRGCLSYVLYVFIVIAAVYLVITYVGQRTEVSGDSMLNTLHNGDNLIVDKLSYRFREPERFEVIIFPSQFEEHTFYIKRIIGLPGETVQIKEGYIYINCERLYESYGNEVMLEETYGIAAEPITLGEDEYFVLGDNRNKSLDSRSEQVGIVHKNEFIGKAWLRIWPFEDFSIVE